MVWDERQAAMLAEMGIRVWQAPAAAASPVIDAKVEAAVSPVAAASPAPVVPRVAVARGARPEDVEAMDWPTLRAAVAGCTACGLCRGRTNTVFGVGHTQAHWMVVGEAPGEQEDRLGEPFVGKAGQLLDHMLQALGLTRRAEGEGLQPAQQVYIANVLKCRPPMNRNPQPEEVAQCEPYLARQVALLQPRLILAMGRFAVQSLLQTGEPIGRLRGRIHQYQGVPAIVTYHPAYLLRNPADKAKAWDDLCLAREVMRGARP
ncbi:uracil-DNA glycosylase [Methylibium petroleiphilum]|uniref:Type-4 uracil-DNA glycosylase n=1 Tax=Methylibium petroleiphilum (strain ATCC BAA-1232 / LMG 22953 / PM1) TaxID=420662 RepID=A2SCH6_METPP|nr:uracil-DNA glycosylase [Methylibium petroleiphilum]ABM93265.1 putative DNA polymerase-related protein, bacteriophage-type [Methylibium petroleiphilum PM1]